MSASPAIPGPKKNELPVIPDWQRSKLLDACAEEPPLPGLGPTCKALGVLHGNCQPIGGRSRRRPKSKSRSKSRSRSKGKGKRKSKK